MTTRRTYDKRVFVEIFTRNRVVRAWDQQLRIDFDIQSSIGDKLGSAKVTIYNLNDDSIGVIRSRRAILRVSAGFVGDQGQDFSGLIFTGVITRAIAEDTHPDTKMQIEANDGYASWSSVRVNVSWAQTTAITVVRDLAQEAGYVLSLDPRIQDVDLPDGYTASGLWRKEFNEIMRTLGADWDTEGRFLYAVPRGESRQRRAVLISEDTGMVGIPKESGRNKFTVRTLLNPAVRKRSIVRIDTLRETFFGRVLQVKHAGSSWDNPFYTDIEVRKITARGSAR